MITPNRKHSVTWQSSELPSPDLLAQQAAWLAPARARVLRHIGIARRRRVLDLGAGYGAVTGELVRRAGGPVVALDRAVHALRPALPFRGASRVGGDAARLPFAAQCFDVVFLQLTLLWITPLAAALDEIARILIPGGVLVALEPDYAGLIEQPPSIATRDLWLTGLRRASRLTRPASLCYVVSPSPRLNKRACTTLQARPHNSQLIGNNLPICPFSSSPPQNQKTKPNLIRHSPPRSPGAQPGSRGESPSWGRHRRTTSRTVLGTCRPPARPPMCD